MSTTTIAVARSRRRTLSWPGGRLITGLCVAIVSLAVIMAAAGPLLAPHDPNAVNLANSFGGPSLSGWHLLGFDSQGRDLFSRLLVGARTAMVGPLAVVVLSIVSGTVLAVATAWWGGWFDSVVGSVLDVLFAFPCSPRPSSAPG
jgi:peptide/nickel transport system permease protein